MFAFMQHFSPQCNGVYLQFRDWFAFALRFVKRPELFERPINPLTCGGAASGTAEWNNMNTSEEDSGHNFLHRKMLLKLEWLSPLAIEGFLFVFGKRPEAISPASA